MRFFLPLVLSFAFCLSGADTYAVFDSASLSTGPFPSDLLTVSDSAQKTGKHVALPPAPCMPPDNGFNACTDALFLNQLDGFSAVPLLRACFTEPVKPQTVTAGMYLFDVAQPRVRIPLNQVAYYSNARCVTAKPNVVLKSTTRYVLAVTRGVLDWEGKQTKAAKEFKDSLKLKSGYFAELGQALQSAVPGMDPIDAGFVSASLFTTLSATDWLEKARAQILSEPPAVPNDFVKVPWGADTSGTIMIDPGVGKSLQPYGVIPPLMNVSEVRFGVLNAPNFLSFAPPVPLTIPPAPTGPRQPIAPASPAVPVGINIFIPSGAPPDGGYPVVIYGHGLGDIRFGATTIMAQTLAQAGFATIAVEIFGHGFGPNSNVVVSSSAGTLPPIPAPGRSVPNPADGTYAPIIGCVIPGSPFASRDCARQTAADMISLITAIKSGPSKIFEGLNASRIYYVGQSFGANVGSLLLNVEPRISAAALNVGGGTTVNVARMQSDKFLTGLFLKSRIPPLMNDTLVLRDEDPVELAPDLVDSQWAFEVAEWLNMSGDPLPYASGFKAPVMFQFATGDQEVPNPANSALIRTANGISRSTLLQYDKALKIAPGDLDPNPHRFMSNPDIGSTEARLSLAIAAQTQIRGFFSSNGTAIPDANLFLTGPFEPKDKLFTVPSKLPETLNFFR